MVMKFVVTNTISIYAVLYDWPWGAIASEIRIHSYSSKHGGAGGWSLSRLCKFKLNSRLFVNWLVMMKLSCHSKYELHCIGCHAT